MPEEEVGLIHPNQGRKNKLLGKELRQHFTKMKEYNLNILENGTRYHYPTNYSLKDFNAKPQSSKNVMKEAFSSCKFYPVILLLNLSQRNNSNYWAILRNKSRN